MPKFSPDRFRTLIPVVACFTLLTLSPVLAENWPQWRGPSGRSISSEKDLPRSWSETSQNITKVPLPLSGTSTPAIWEDAIFVTVENEGKLQLIKFNRQTLKQEWLREVGQGTANRKVEGGSSRAPKYHDIHNMASPSPVTDGEVVIVHFGNGDLAAYNFQGDQLWKQNLAEVYGNYTIWWGHANSPVLYDNLVISVCMQDSLADLQDKPVLSYVVAHDRLT
ncbi:MAG: hypothetical protein R3C11_29725, partial [Planctomycetaceae bacterium]